jgi:hypothetical protein
MHKVIPEAVNEQEVQVLQELQEKRQGVQKMSLVQVIHNFWSTVLIKH